MSKSLSSLTKAELIGVINTKDAELAVLRARVSQLSAPVATAPRPAWLVEVEAKREAMAYAKAEAMRTGRAVKVRQ